MLAVEILSPLSERIDKGQKRQRYARGASVLSHPDWPDLAIDLAALWQ